MSDKRINKKIKLIIIGGSTIGLQAATRARRINEDIEISIIDESNYIGIPNSILPGYSSGEIKDKESLFFDNEERISNIYNIKIYKKHKAVEINKDKKEIMVKNLNTNKIIQIVYDKLILAVGNKIQQQKISKTNFTNVFIQKNLNDSINIRNYIEKTAAKEIAIVGGNYSGLVTANSFINKGFNVTIIEKKPILLDDLDEEFSFLIKEELIKEGAKIYLNSTIKDFIRIDKEKVSSIRLANGTEIKTHLIIFFNPVNPDIDLIKKIPLELGDTGKIKINEKMETSDPNIYAIGNIAETYNFITKKPETRYITGTPTQQQARVAGTNAAGGSSTYKGTQETKFIALKNLTVGIIGLNTNIAKKNGFDIMPVTIFTGSHERFIPGSDKLHLKIIVNKENRKILGAQLCGKNIGVDKRLDILSTTIYSSLTVDDLINLDLCYSPGISTLKDPINILGMVASARLDGLSNAIEFYQIPVNENTFILDVRSKNDYSKSHIENSIWIPLDELRKRLDEIPKDKNIYVYGNLGLQGHIAERILTGNGFQNVFNIEGGISSIKISEGMHNIFNEI